MSVMMSEQEHANKRKIFTILGIFLVIIGFSCFISGPIIAMITRKYYLFFLSFLGVFFLFPGFILLSLGTQRAFTSFVAQSVGPVAVDATHKYGAPIAKEMAKSVTKGVKEGLSEEEEKEEIFCKYCGNTIDADSEFCKYCGRKIN